MPGRWRGGATTSVVTGLRLLRYRRILLPRGSHSHRTYSNDHRWKCSAPRKFKESFSIDVSIHGVCPYKNYSSKAILRLNGLQKPQEELRIDDAMVEAKP